MSTRALTKHISVSFVVICLFAVGLIAQAQTTSDGIEVIDLRFWNNQKGLSLAHVNEGNSMALVALVSPNCDTCAKSRNAMEELRERAKKAGIAYYVLMIPDGTDTNKYFSYADSLKINAESFVWINPEVKASPTLTAMPVPSHVLLSVNDRYEGRIVNKWAGVPPLTALAQLKFIDHPQNAIPDHYIVVLNDDVVTKTATLEARQAQVRAIADEFAQLHAGKVGYIYETAIYGFSIHLPSKEAAIEISQSPKVRFVEQDSNLSLGAQVKNP